MKKKDVFLVFMAFAVVLLTGGSLMAADIEVSQNANLTANSAYDRNPSIVYDGSDYWLFYTKGDDISTGGVRGTGYDPDADKYYVYYKTASTIDGLAAATETKLDKPRPVSFDQRTVSATYFNGKIYAFVSSGQSGVDRSMYYYDYSGGSWTGPTLLTSDNGGHINVASDASYAYIVWESGDGSADCYVFDGSTLSSKIDISSDNMPKITVMGSTLYVASIEDGTGDIEIYSAAAGASPSFSAHSTAIPGSGLYDPCIFNDGTNLYVISAPYVGANDQQYLVQAYDLGAAGSWSAAKQVTWGGYGSTYWWDFWPEGYYDGSDLCLFFTTESASPSFGDAEISMIKMDWDLDNDHFLHIQNAVNYASAGDQINVDDGTYYEALNLTKDNLGIIGNGSGQMTIDCGGLAGYNNAGIYVTGNGVTLQGFTFIGEPSASAPRYGLKFGAVTGGTVDDLIVKEFYRTGIDMLGSDGISLTDVESKDNGGNGIQSTDASNITYTNITTSGNAWGGVGVFTYGQYTPIGTDNIVFSGTNSFGESGTDNGGLYLEEGNYADPGNPYPITFSTNAMDGANVTVQLSDFGFIMGGESDNSNNYTRFYGTLSEVLTAAAGAPGHILGGRFIQNLTDGSFYVDDLPNMTIQAAVDAADPGDLITVEAGTYTEQVRIYKDDLTIDGAGVDVTIIKSPASLTEFFVTGSNNNYPVVFIDDATGITLTELTVDGDHQGDTNARFDGIGFWNGGGTVTTAKVINVMNSTFSGAQHGVGIYSYNNTGGPYSITLNDVLIDDFQKNAIALLGSGLTVDVDNVTTTGEGLTTVTAQNGIQIGPGVSGTVDNCDISDVAYDGTSWTATGFLNEGDVTATGLNIDGCQTSVYWIDGSGTFTQCTITNPLGDGFYAYNSTTTKSGNPKLAPQPIDPEFIGSTDKAAMAVTVSYTDMTGTGAEYSWGIGAFSTSADAVDLTVENCSIDNWDYGVVAYDYGGPVNTYTHNNSITNCTYALAASETVPNIQDASGNYYGTTDVATVEGMVDFAFDYSPWLGSGTYTSPGFEGDYSTLYIDANSPKSGTETLLIEALGLVSGSTIYLAPGTYPEGPQVVIDEDVTIVGDSKNTVTIVPTANTGSSGDARGWFLVNAGVTLDMSEVTMDGSGYDIYQGVRSYSTLIFDDIIFQNIKYSTYLGMAVAVMDANPTITYCDFSNIGRLGVIIFGSGSTSGLIDHCTYVGKGDGDWLDYFVEFGGGGGGSVTNCEISNNTGIASSDGSTSAGILATTYFGPGTNATLEGNYIHDCTTGLAIGFDDTDASSATVTDGNRFLNNEYGITTTASSSINLLAYGNTFNNTNNAEDDAGGTWDNGTYGNCWSDYSGTGTYTVGGAAGAVDYYPTSDCMLDMTPDDIVFHCDGNFTFDVAIGDALIGLDAANFTIMYPYNIDFVTAVEASGNYQLFYSEFDNVSGYDSVQFNFGVLSGSLDGPATLFTIEMTGSSDICPGDEISMIYANLRGHDGDIIITIPTPLPEAISLAVDCSDPVFTANTADGGYYNAPPLVNIEASDNCDLDAIYYQVDACGPGGWNALASALTGTTYGPTDWTLPTVDWDALSEASHCIYFKVMDDNGRGNSDSCSFSWCFTKDITPPPPPTNLTAAPGHNKISLQWTNATSDYDHTVIVRNDYVDGGGHGYPEYDDAFTEAAYPADTSDGDLLYSGTGNSLVDTYNLTVASRDVYHFAAFTVDLAGNISAGTTGSQARSTSYWLGDVAPALNYDGYIYFQDLSVFSNSYGTSDGDGYYNSECDFGPTFSNSTKGIPTTDNQVEFEDLTIFAINFDDVTPAAKSLPIFSGNPQVPGTGIRVTSRIDGHSCYLDIFLENGTREAKSLIAEIAYNPEEMIYQSTDYNVELIDGDRPVFVKTLTSDNRISVSSAVLGNDQVFDGSGMVATMRFDMIRNNASDLILTRADIRNNANEQMLKDFIEQPILASAAVPQKYELEQNRPNPFNPQTEIAYSLPEETRVTIKVYNIAGQVVRTLVDDVMPAGEHKVIWDGTNQSSGRVASGVYFYRMETAAFQKTAKMILVK